MKEKNEILKIMFALYILKVQRTPFQRMIKNIEIIILSYIQ